MLLYILISFRLDHKGKQKAVGDFFAEQLEGISHEVLFQPITLSQDDNIAIECVHVLIYIPLNCSH